MKDRCGGGGFSPGQCVMIQLLPRVKKPLSHYSDRASPEVQNTYSHLGAPFTFTMPFQFAEYADMIYVYDFCDGIQFSP
jgi:hypothetical protein